MQRKTSSVLAKISNMTKGFLFDAENPFILQQLADFHQTLHAFMQICEMYRQHLDPARFKSHIKELLTTRAARIINTPNCYTLSPFSVTNQICEVLAMHCDAEHHTALLLPEVSADDIFGNNINEIGIRNFMLTDDGKQFICFQSVVETALARMESDEVEIFLTTDEKGIQRSLTANELVRLGNIREKLLAIKTNMNKEGWWNWLFESSQNRFYNELIALREGLRKGDAGHNGEELNAGADANAAIVKFNEYYKKISAAKREEINEIGTGNENLGTIFNLLFRDPGKSKDDQGMSVVYCLQIIGRHLDSSMSKNKNQIKGIGQSKQELLASLKDQLLEDIKNRNQIQLGMSSVLSTAAQREILISAIDQTCSLYNDNHAMCLGFFTRFIATEVANRLTASNQDPKTARYIRLLSRLAYESAMIPCRSETAKRETLMNLFASIAQITSTSTRKLLRFKSPESIDAWNKFLVEHGLLHAFPFIHNDRPAITYIGDLPPESPNALQLDPAYVNYLNQAEVAKEFQEWAEQHPYSAMFLKYSQPIIDYVIGKTQLANRLAREAHHNPHTFFEQHKRELLTSAAISAAALLVLRCL